MNATPLLKETTRGARSTGAPNIFDLGGSDEVSPEQAARLDKLVKKYEGLAGQNLLEPLLREEFIDKIAVVSSFGSESAVLLHMVSQIDPTVPVIFLNTGKLFGETLRYRDRLQERLGLADLRAIGPHPDDLKDEDPDGVLWNSDPDQCCAIRKVRPLERALKAFDAQITGRKRFQTQARLAMPTIEVSGGKFKINPLALWGLEELEAYRAQYKLPKHPLVKDGYLSIGCMPCTDRVKEGEDYRSGRWAGRDKDECGIHGPSYTGGDGI